MNVVSLGVYGAVRRFVGDSVATETKFVNGLRTCEKSWGSEQDLSPRCMITGEIHRRIPRK